jgi:hypothetical protein
MNPDPDGATVPESTSLPDPHADLNMTAGLGRAGHADQETHIQNGRGLPKGPIRQIAAASSADARVAKSGWYAALLVGVAFLSVLAVLFRQNDLIIKQRIPVVEVDGKSPATLVQTSPEFKLGKDFEGISLPPNVIRAELANFLDMRFGVSQLHARSLWPKLVNYWLPEEQVRPFEDYSAKVFAQATKEGWWRRIVLTNAMWDPPRHLKEGGEEVDARVDFREEDLKLDSMDPIHSQAYTMHIVFRIGESVPISNPNQKVLFYTMNPLNFRPVKVYQPSVNMADQREPVTLGNLPPRTADAGSAVPGVR